MIKMVACRGLAVWENDRGDPMRRKQALPF